jgi:hypothetical protein
MKEIFLRKLRKISWEVEIGKEKEREDADGLVDETSIGRNWRYKERTKEKKCANNH